jgi:pimeloyl-ACP methyl ester carboxylesterase
VVATTPIGNRPGGVAIGDGSLWVTPHRRNSLLRLDPSVNLEAAAAPDVARTIDVESGTVYLRCSGDGSPTAIIPGNTGEGPAWAVVEARLSRTTRVCAYEPVGIADPAEIGQGGPASQVAADLAAVLAESGESGPFVVVGEWMGGLATQMLAAEHRDIVAGMVLVHGLSTDYFERLADVLPADALDRMDVSLRDDPGLQWLDESLAEVSEIGEFGDLPLVVLGDAPADYAAMTANGDPFFYTVAESEAIGRLLEETQRELAGRSNAGRFVVADGAITPDDIVGAVTSLVEGG